MKYICRIASFLQSKDGSIIDGDGFLERAAAKLDQLADVLTESERLKIERAMVEKLKRPKQRPPGATWHGMVPDDHEIYKKAGWNFLMGKNLSGR